MRLFPRLLIVAALGWLMAVLFFHARTAMAVENADPTKMILYFGMIVLVGLAIGSVVALSFIPALGDWVGNFFFSPNVEIEKAPHADAMAKVAQGDFAGAIEEYRAAFERDPTDAHALLEMSHLYCDKVGDSESGATVLESALEHEWTPDQSALLCNKLADVYLHHQQDPLRARALLAQVAESMPDTKYAANAVHRMHEIDRSLG